MRAPSRRSRGDRLTTAWMIAALALFFMSVAFRSAIPQAWWLSIHLVTLGVLTNAVLQWTWYFARALLRLAPSNRHAGVYQYVRQLVFNVFLVLLVVGMMAARLTVVVAAAAGVAAVIAWHGLSLVVATRARLGSRFAVVIRYYAGAAVFLVVGAVEGAFIAAGMFQADAPAWLVEVRAGLTLSHALTNAFGWIGLTILGTLVTLWPTMLRTRIAPNAVNRAVRALPFLIVGLSLGSVASALGWLQIAALGLLIYLAAAVWGVGLPLLSEAVRKHPAGYATWSAGTGFAWGSVGVAMTVGALFLAQGPQQFQEASPTLIVIVGVGGALQILVGALTYLLPVVVGGGPAVVRIGIAVLEKWAVARLVLRNGALALALVGGAAAPAFFLLVALSFVADLGLLGADGVIQGRAKRRNQALQDREVWL